MTSANRPLRILLLSDTRPGHFRLSEGVAAAIARLVPTVVTTVIARRPRWAGPPLALATNAQAPPAMVLRRVFAIDPAAVLPADLVISAGAETLAANVALARLGGIPNIFYGSLRQFRARDFALALTSYGRAGMPANQVVTLKPSAVDPDCPPPLPPALGPGLAATSGPYDALILGGNAPGVRWSAHDWSRLQALTAAGAGRTGRWIVANSRRTPEAASDAFAALAQASPDRIAFIDVRWPDAPSLAGVLSHARIAVVTADSSTMLSEAIWARRPVIAVHPLAIRLTRDESGYRRWLRDARWVVEATTDELAAKAHEEIAAAAHPIASNPQADLAALIGARLPGLLARSPMVTAGAPV